MIIKDLLLFRKRKKHGKWKICIMITVSGARNYDKIGSEETLRVRRVSYTAVQSGFWHRERFLTEQELIYVTGGTVYLLLNGEHIDIGENEYLFLPAYATISASRRSDAPCSFYSVTFDGTVALPSEEGKKGKARGDLLFSQELFKRMLLRYEADKVEHAACDALFLSFLYESADARTEGEETAFDTQRMLDYIHAHLDHPLELEELTERFHYSRDAITKAFCRRYGISPKRYINQTKINAAKQLLTTSRMSIGQIGRTVGFDDVRLFYKFFAYHTGVTPSVFRRRNE